MCADNVFPRIISPDPAEGDAAPEPAPEPASPAAERRGFSYAALVRRAQRRMPALPADDARAPRHAARRREDDANAWPAAASFAPEYESADDPDDAIADEVADATADNAAAADRDRDASESRAMRVAAPIVAALAVQQARVAQLMHFLATRIADFCSDEAIVASGHWRARIPLDPSLLPDCVLNLTLSHFELVLRFEARDAVVRQLIYAHRTALERQLETLLDALDSPREVSVDA